MDVTLRTMDAMEDFKQGVTWSSYTFKSSLWMGSVGGNTHDPIRKQILHPTVHWEFGKAERDQLRNMSSVNTHLPLKARGCGTLRRSQKVWIRTIVGQSIIIP